MQEVLDRLVSRFEQRKCSRRELLATLGVLVAAGPVPALQASPPLFRCRELNHVTLRVANLGRSKAFYNKLLGLPVLRETSDTCRLGLGRGFLSLWQDSAAGIDHWCVGVEPFTRTSASANDRTRDAVRVRLERDGFSLRRDEGDSTIYVRDPDGNAVQLEAPGFAS
jgi:catechol 2,3-dioxygenase-like lactoylglutathione lyase family enzyme